MHASQPLRHFPPLDLRGLAVLLAVLLKGPPVGVDVLADVVILCSDGCMKVRLRWTRTALSPDQDTRSTSPIPSSHSTRLGQVEQLADLAGPLGSAHAGLLIIGEARQLRLSLLDNLQVQNRQVRGDDASADRFTTALT